MQYYISDLHFQHDNIIKLCDRPFTSTKEMNEKLIEKWNSKIQDDDIVYFLGDFTCRGNNNEATRILKQLKGHKVFIRGNHDKVTWLESVHSQGLIESYTSYMEVNDNDRKVILCYYPIHSWNGLYRGSYHLYGHVHTKTVINEDWQKRRFNVCCEVINYEPKTLDELINLYIGEEDNNEQFE